MECFRICKPIYRVHTRQGIFYFFKVREFHDVSGENEILPKCQGIIKEFCYYSHEC